MILGGVLTIVLSLSLLVYGFYLRHLCSPQEGAKERYDRVMRGDHLRQWHLNPAYDVAAMMLSRESRSRKYWMCGGVGLLVGVFILVFEFMR